MGPKRRRRARSWAWAGSLLVHALVVAGFATLPSRPSAVASRAGEEALVLRWVEVTPAPERSLAPSAEDEVKARAQPRTPVSPSVYRSLPQRPGARPRRGGQTRGKKKTAGGGRGGLALRGLREASRSDAKEVPPANATGADAPQSLRGPQRRPDRTVSEVLAEHGFDRSKGGTFVRVRDDLPFDATISADGRMSFVSRKPGGFEYYAQKTKLQRATFAVRLRLARRWARRQIALELARLPRRLSEVWTRTDRSPAQRRRTLFELWDECAEATPSKRAGDDVEDVLRGAREAAGSRARAAIVTFIREQAPRGSAEAYGVEELKRLNGARASRARFAPYAQVSGRSP